MCTVNLKHIMAGLNKIIDDVEDQYRYLSELDSVAGDGDHGIALNKCFQRVSARFKVQEPQSISEAFRIVGDTFLDYSGGATGPLYGMFFLKLSANSSEKSELTLHDLARIFGSALDTVAELGGAQPGDKTLIDTLDPAIRNLQESSNEHRKLVEALKAFDDTARKGMESTAGIQAKMGRASRLGERSRGHLDAGAASSYLILHALVLGMIGDESS